jgi:hypothetical protein
VIFLRDPALLLLALATELLEDEGVAGSIILPLPRADLLSLQAAARRLHGEHLLARQASHRKPGSARSYVWLFIFLRAWCISTWSLKVGEYVAVAGKLSGSAGGKPVAPRDEPEDG